MDPNKRRKRGDGEERKRKKKTSTPHPVPDKNHRVDDMFKAINAKKVIATRSGSNTSAGASVGESSVRSEELAGGSNTRAGASVGESSVRSEELAGGSNTSAGASVGESSVRSEELAGRTRATSQQPSLPKMDASGIKKEETDQCIKGEKGHHDSHSFAYSIVGKKRQREITCSTPQTILDALLTQSFFEHEHNANTVKDEELQEVKDKEHKKVINKELVILRDKKAISSHFPCWLIGKEYPLTILYINAEGNSEPPKSVVGSPQCKSVIFHLETEGSENIKNKILNNINLKGKAKVKKVSVYAFEGETVEFALERDGRFKSVVFSTCALENVSNDRITEITNLVNNLGGKTFKVIRDEKYASLKRRSKPEPVPCASTSTNYSTKASTSTSSPQPSSTHVAVNTDKAEQTAKLNTSPTLAKPFPIPDSKAILDLLRSQFKGLFKHMKGREGKLTPVAKRQEFRVEYGKNDERCNTVKMQRQLMVRADSVCQVRLEGKAKGSGFLLFDKFILTNAHVINDFYNRHTKQLTQNVTVSFCFEDVESLVDSVPVKPEVVVFNYNMYDTGFYYDWALLELDSAKNIPCGLLEHFATPPQSRGGICIIGHPDGGVKKTDTCHTIPGDESEKVALDRYKAYQYLVTKLYFGPFEEARLKNEHTDLSYDTCFCYGSSGSPVFNEFCNVVAMHTGGYVYETEARKGQTQSFIEYAQPLSRILPRIILHIVERRDDVLEAYLQYTSDHPERKATWDQLKEEVVRIGNMQNCPTIVKEFLERYDRVRHNQSEDMDTD